MYSRKIDGSSKNIGQSSNVMGFLDQFMAIFGHWELDGEMEVA